MQAAVLHGQTTTSQIVGNRATSGVPYLLLNPDSTWDGLQSAFLQQQSFRPLWDRANQSFRPPPMANATGSSQQPAADNAGPLGFFPIFRPRPTTPATPAPPPGFDERLELLQGFNTAEIHSPHADAWDRFQNTGTDLIRGGGAFFNALTLSPDRRRRYGNSLAGNMLLTARQLIDAGAGAVTAYHEPTFQAWDMHDNMRRKMLDMGSEMDVALEALMAEQRDEIILVMGEFNRTFQMNNSGGRDHNRLGNTAVLKGATIRGGAVYGRTNRDSVVDGLVSQRTAFQNTVLAACGVELNPAAPRVRDVLRAS
jgi:hypothetical protein